MKYIVHSILAQQKLNEIPRHSKFASPCTAILRTEHLPWYNMTEKRKHSITTQKHIRTNKISLSLSLFIRTDGVYLRD